MNRSTDNLTPAKRADLDARVDMARAVRAARADVAPGVPLNRLAPGDVESIMASVSDALDLHGVETIRDANEDGRTFWHDAAALYANAGDSYALTVVYDIDARSFQITSWADWLEYQEARGRAFH